MRFVAAALLALTALAPAAAQPPRDDHGPDWRRDHGPRDHGRGDWRRHRRCRIVWHHGHRVRRCY